MEIQALIQKLLQFLRDHAPTPCYCCHEYYFHKDTTTEQLTTGPVVHLCPRCHSAIFGFWGPE